MIFDLYRIGATLPVSVAAERITAALSKPTSAVVVQAPPGTGKTTVVPPVIANMTAPQKVVVTAPRRVAVRAAARRLADLDGSMVGDRVGYSVRGDSRPGSLVEFVTPGILIRRLLRDPDLPGVGAVVIDEVHERQVETDLLLGMLIELQQLRDDLRLVAMSATVDADRFAQLLSAPVIATDAVFLINLYLVASSVVVISFQRLPSTRWSTCRVEKILLWCFYQGCARWSTAMKCLVI